MLHRSANDGGDIAASIRSPGRICHGNDAPGAGADDQTATAAHDGCCRLAGVLRPARRSCAPDLGRPSDRATMRRGRIAFAQTGLLSRAGTARQARAPPPFPRLEHHDRSATAVPVGAVIGPARELASGLYYVSLSSLGGASLAGSAARSPHDVTGRTRRRCRR